MMLEWLCPDEADEPINALKSDDMFRKDFCEEVIRANSNCQEILI